MSTKSVHNAECSLKDVGHLEAVAFSASVELAELATPCPDGTVRSAILRMHITGELQG